MPVFVRTIWFDDHDQVRVRLLVKVVCNVLKQRLSFFAIPRNLIKDRKVGFVTGEESSSPRGHAQLLSGEKASGRPYCFQTSERRRAFDGRSNLPRHGRRFHRCLAGTFSRQGQRNKTCAPRSGKAIGEKRQQAGRRSANMRNFARVAYATVKQDRRIAFESTIAKSCRLFG